MILDGFVTIKMCKAVINNFKTIIKILNKAIEDNDRDVSRANIEY